MPPNVKAHREDLLGAKDQLVTPQELIEVEDLIFVPHELLALVTDTFKTCQSQKNLVEGL